jgi:hypothetical protein
MGAATSVHLSDTEGARTVGDPGTDGGVGLDATEAITGVNCGACEGVDEMGGFGDGVVGLATALPQAGQKRIPDESGFPQCVQNWAMVNSSR